MLELLKPYKNKVKKLKRTIHSKKQPMYRKNNNSNIDWH